MGCCSGLCCVKVVALVTGLAATTLLTIAIVILPWISISEFLPTEVLHKQVMVRRDVRSVTSPPGHDAMKLEDESSGEVDDLLIYGHVTTWPGPEPVPEEPSDTFLKPAAKYPHGIVPPTNRPTPPPSTTPTATPTTTPTTTPSTTPTTTPTATPSTTPTTTPTATPTPPPTAAPPRHDMVPPTNRPTPPPTTTPPTVVPIYIPARPALNLPTDPPTRYSTPVNTDRPPPGAPDGALLRTGLEVGLWRVCLTRTYLEWRTRWELLMYTDVPNTTWEGDDQCWGTNPFFPPSPPPDDVILRVSTIIGLLKDYHFILSLAVSSVLLVVAVLVTSGGMARNNAVILAGAAFYEFSALVLAISLIWFYQTIVYAEPSWGPTTQLHATYFGHTEKIIADVNGPRPQIRHYYGLAFFVAIGAFVMINMAGAASIATFRMSANKATPYNFIRREREAVKKANKQWLVTRL